MSHGTGVIFRDRDESSELKAGFNSGLPGLVNCYITMENYYLNRQINYKLDIFYSYVSLPEGNRDKSGTMME